MTSTAAETATSDALPYDAYLAGQAQQVFTQAKNIEWPDAGRKAIGNAVWDLGMALKRYHDLRNGLVPPYLPGIEAGPEGFAKALRMVAEAAWEAAGDVVEAIREHAGPDAAEEVAA